MNRADKSFPTLEQALASVGSGTGFGSLVVRNGRSNTGHIYCERTYGALCGVERRIAPYFDTEVRHEDEEFPGWLKLNWELGLCRACLRALPREKSRT